jgi:hypothetical protein
MEVSGQLHVLAAFPQGKNPWYPLDRRLGDVLIFLLNILTPEKVILLCDGAEIC